MIPHLRHLEEKLGHLPENVTTDAGYGSEENYEYLEEKNAGSYVKYNKFHWEKKKENRENPYLAENLSYLPESDSFVCRNERRLVHVGNRKYVTEAGYETRRDYYRCEDCSGCHYASECKHTKKNRTIQVSHRLNELKKSKRKPLLRKRTDTAFTKGCGSGTGLWEDQRLLDVPSFSLVRSG